MGSGKLGHWFIGKTPKRVVLFGAYPDCSFCHNSACRQMVLASQKGTRPLTTHNSPLAFKSSPVTGCAQLEFWQFLQSG